MAGHCHVAATSSEVTLPLAVLHGCFARPVVSPGLPALCEPRGADLSDHLVKGLSRGLDGARATDVAHRAVPDHRLEHGLAVCPVREGMVGEQYPIPLEYRAAVREVDGRDLEILPGYVVPDIKLGP